MVLVGGERYRGSHHREHDGHRFVGCELALSAHVEQADLGLGGPQKEHEGDVAAHGDGGKKHAYEPPYAARGVVLGPLLKHGVQGQEAAVGRLGGGGGGGGGGVEHADAGANIPINCGDLVRGCLALGGGRIGGLERRVGPIRVVARVPPVVLTVVLLGWAMLVSRSHVDEPTAVHGRTTMHGGEGDVPVAEVAEVGSSG